MVIHHNRLSGALIRGALNATGGNVKAAAARLSVQRNLLYRRMTQFRIEPRSFRHRHAPGDGAAQDAEGAGVFAGDQRTADREDVLAGCAQVPGDTRVPARAEVFAGGTHVFTGARVFERTQVFGSGAEVHHEHKCSPRVVHVPPNGDGSGKRCSDSSSFGAVEDTVAGTDQQDDRVNRTVSLPRAEVALLAQQRRLLSAALNVDLTDGAMLALLIQECLVGWVGQKVAEAARPSRPPTRGEGRNRRRR
jgi:hypothetical protein